MKFCPECGCKIEGMKFCPECGHKNSGEEHLSTSSQETDQKQEAVIIKFSTYLYGMEGKKKNVIGGIDISIPQYTYILTNERLLIEKRGVVSSKKEEIELYKINDIEVRQGVAEKLQKIGDIEIVSSDESTPTLVLRKIKDPFDIKEVIRRAVQDRKRIVGMSYHQSV